MTVKKTDATEVSRVRVSGIVESALKSGALNPKMTIQDITERFGPDIDEVAGYVLAWDKYVLVVKEADIMPEIHFTRR